MQRENRLLVVMSCGAAASGASGRTHPTPSWFNPPPGQWRALHLLKYGSDAASGWLTQAGARAAALENLNPPTEPELVNADWLKAGRASWDYLAGDRDNPQVWIDFVADMGWEYHLVDARFERRFDVSEATEYAHSKQSR